MKSTSALQTSLQVGWSAEPLDTVGVPEQSNAAEARCSQGCVAMYEINSLREDVRVGMADLLKILKDVYKKQKVILQRLDVASFRKDGIPDQLSVKEQPPYSKNEIATAGNGCRSGCKIITQQCDLAVSMNEVELTEPWFEARLTEGEVAKAIATSISSAVCDSKQLGPAFSAEVPHQNLASQLGPADSTEIAHQNLGSLLSTEIAKNWKFAQGSNPNLSGHLSDKDREGRKKRMQTCVKRLDSDKVFGSYGVDSSTLDQEIYDVSNFYYDTGLCQAIARSDLFSNITLAIIALNTVYIGVELDRNPTNVDADANLPIPFLVCDCLFCSYFTFEWIIRFSSFRRKADCARDMWFRFDTALVILMIWETWVMPLLILSKVSEKSGSAGPVGLIRMLRLLRLARMARLMRAFPELIAMIKGVRVAAKAVGSALMMLVLLIYTFAIIMFVQLRDNSISKLVTKFETLGNSMWTMLCDGVFLDGFSTVTFALLIEDRYLEVAILVLFVLASNLTVMNMLIGVLCEVVSEVAAAEKEGAAVKLMKETLLVMLKNLDEDESGMLSKKEILNVLEDDDAQIVLASLAVDVNPLLEQLDMAFSKTMEISIQDIMDIILMLRGERPVTVKDMTHGQGVTRWRLEEVKGEIMTLHQKIDSLTGKTKSNRQTR